MYNISPECMCSRVVCVDRPPPMVWSLYPTPTITPTPTPTPTPAPTPTPTPTPISVPY